MKRCFCATMKSTVIHHDSAVPDTWFYYSALHRFVGGITLRSGCHQIADTLHNRIAPYAD